MSKKQNLILREVSNILIPAIMLFALYVQFHGDYGPGGGFQAGAIFAAAIFLFALVYGRDRVQKVLPMSIVRVFVAVGLILYVGVGYATMLLGENYLDYNALLTNPLHAQHLGIFLIELGVGITVAAVMIAIFYALDEFAEKE